MSLLMLSNLTWLIDPDGGKMSEASCSAPASVPQSSSSTAAFLVLRVVFYLVVPKIPLVIVAATEQLISIFTASVVCSLLHKWTVLLYPHEELVVDSRLSCASFGSEWKMFIDDWVLCIPDGRALQASAGSALSGQTSLDCPPLKGGRSL